MINVSHKLISNSKNFKTFSGTETQCSGSQGPMFHCRGSCTLAKICSAFRRGPVFCVPVSYTCAIPGGKLCFSFLRHSNENQNQIYNNFFQLEISAKKLKKIKFYHTFFLSYILNPYKNTTSLSDSGPTTSRRITENFKVIRLMLFLFFLLRFH